MFWSPILALILLAPGVDDPAKADPLAEAKALRDKEEWAEAAAKFREALDKDLNGPVAPEARFWAGFCLVKPGEYKEAVELLEPFETTLAENTWADDALLQLGLAYLGDDDKDRALAIWNRQLDKYRDSVWRLEVMLKVVDLQFSEREDFPACLAACERVVAEFPDRGATREARYDGAYCLNALRRFADSEAWVEKNFDPEDSLEEAWRTVLGAQRDLLRGKVDNALVSIDAIEANFPDLDHDARQDLNVRTRHMLRFNGRADRARQLVLNELVHSSGRSEDEVVVLLNELHELIGEDQPFEVARSLGDLVRDPKMPLIVRVAALDRRAHLLVDNDDLNDGLSILRSAIYENRVEYARVRAALTLAEILDEKSEDKAAAAKVLTDLLPTIKRRDLANQVRNAAEKYQGEQPKP